VSNCKRKSMEFPREESSKVAVEARKKKFGETASPACGGVEGQWSKLGKKKRCRGGDGGGTNASVAPQRKVAIRFGVSLLANKTKKKPVLAEMLTGDKEGQGFSTRKGERVSHGAGIGVWGERRKTHVRVRTKKRQPEKGGK